jgi:glycosyltransferase involved in cell wall biosynthesis
MWFLLETTGSKNGARSNAAPSSLPELEMPYCLNRNANVFEPFCAHLPSFLHRPMRGIVKISVCMATYNGRRFIERQIESIRSQLGPDDEIIVTDDGSNDGTVEFLEGVADHRLKVRRNPTRLGHVRNFASCMELATGDVIFLSDQDDQWAPDKVAVVKGVFERDASITLVHHALRYVDTEGRPQGHFFRPSVRGKQPTIAFLMKQLRRGQLFGCGCAMRRSSFKFMLPFPPSVYAHDHWLAIVHAICGGIFLSDAPLVDYRQHGGNLTPTRRVKLRTQLLWRFKSLQQIAIAYGRRKCGER